MTSAGHEGTSSYEFTVLISTPNEDFPTLHARSTEKEVIIWSMSYQLHHRQAFNGSYIRKSSHGTRMSLTDLLFHWAHLKFISTSQGSSWSKVSISNRIIGIIVIYSIHFMRYETSRQRDHIIEYECG